MSIQPLILAAGKGTRMRSSKPKVLQPLGGKPMLAHVLDNVQAVNDVAKPLVVVGFGAEQIKASFFDELSYVQQAEQLGTGHAVASAEAELDDNSVVLVLYGDVPFVSTNTLQRVVDGTISVDGAERLSLLTVNLDEPAGYGRILRNERAQVVGIVEQKDATAEQLLVDEVNTGILAVKGTLLKKWVLALSNDNAQGEYYLTDIVAMAVAESVAINVSQPDDAMEVLGANDRAQLAQLETYYRCQRATDLMSRGATLFDPSRIDIRGEVEIGRDLCVDVNVVFEGNVVLGDDVIIESHCLIKDSTIASGSRIRAFSHIEKATIGENTVIGPYARLREGSVIADQAKIGNFVETKNIQLGRGSKANHLTYLGDSEIGAGVNIGAGTITCNYDGKNKSKTIIADDVFVGSNSALVAPVKLGEGSTVAAGSVVTRDVGNSELCIARQKQRSIRQWVRPDQTDKND